MAPKKKLSRTERMALERAAMSGMENAAAAEEEAKKTLRETTPCPICNTLNCTSELIL